MPLTQVSTGMIADSAVTQAKMSSDLQMATYGMKNRIINGSMMIDKRNEGASVSLTTPTTYVMDRWSFRSNTSITVQRSTTATTGFVNSAYVTVPTGAASAAGNFNVMQQTIEGFNISDLAWGTANASAVTLSFKVRSTQTGTFAGSLRNGAGDRSYVFTFSIAAANTWTSVSITIAGDTAGTWATDNTAGMIVTFDLGSGSTFETTAGAWTAGNYSRTSGAVQLTATSSANLYITGVQLEKGSTATSFDYRPYGTELALCQRYLPAYNATAAGNQNIGMGLATAVTQAYLDFQFLVAPRVPPTGVVVSAASHFGSTDAAFSSTTAFTGLTFTQASPKSALLFGSGGGGMLQGNATMYRSMSASAYFYFTGCEL